MRQLIVTSRRTTALAGSGTAETAAHSDHTHSGTYAAAGVETQARTATVTGATTGTITDPTSGSVFVTVTSDDANKIIVLPTPTPGTEVRWYVGANGFELRSSAPASVGINGGTGANAESAIPANTYGVARCATATNWVCHEIAADGVLSTVEVAAA